MSGSFVTGYSGGLAVTISLTTVPDLTVMTVGNLILYPTIAGLIVALPQLGKVLNEYGDLGKNSK